MGLDDQRQRGRLRFSLDVGSRVPGGLYSRLLGVLDAGVKRCVSCDGGILAYRSGSEPLHPFFEANNYPEDRRDRQSEGLIMQSTGREASERRLDA